MISVSNRDILIRDSIRKSSLLICWLSIIWKSIASSLDKSLRANKSLYILMLAKGVFTWWEIWVTNDWISCLEWIVSSFSISNSCLYLLIWCNNFESIVSSYSLLLWVAVLSKVLKI